MLSNYTPTFNAILKQVTSLYNTFVPDKIKYRKNIHLAKQPDTVLLTCYLYGILHSCTTLIGIYRLSKERFGLVFPSRTRFIRTCSHLKQSLELMNQGLLQTNISQNEKVGIIDSLPVPLCQPIRNHRVKGASEIASIGFNATKKIWFYGLKVHAIVNLQV
jgi:hypothetical protein